MTGREWSPVPARARHPRGVGDARARVRDARDGGRARGRARARGRRSPFVVRRCVDERERRARGAADDGDAVRAYASNDALAHRVEEIARTTCRGLARTRVLGKTTRGRRVIALELGTHVRGGRESTAIVGADEVGAAATGADADGDGGDGGDGSAEGRLRFGFMGNMHGDEPVGREIALDVARWVCERANAERLAAPSRRRARRAKPRSEAWRGDWCARRRCSLYRR